MSDKTGGIYWKAESPGAMVVALHNIDTLEIVERRVGIQVVGHSQHQIFIIIGTLFIAFAVFVRRILLRETP